jgi:hypothetical protein
VINGPGMILTQWLRLSRDIAYREIGVLVAFVSFPFEIVIHETLIRAVINGPGMILTQWLRLSRDIAYREIGVLVAFVSFPFEIAIHETPMWSLINGSDQPRS